MAPFDGDGKETTFKNNMVVEGPVSRQTQHSTQRVQVKHFFWHFHEIPSGGGITWEHQIHASGQSYILFT